MRIAHKVRAPRVVQPVVLDEDYQREVDRSTEKLTRRYEQARKAAEKAQERLHEAERATAKARRAIDVRALRLEVERRLDELKAIESLMTTSPAGAAHRGVESWTKVPR